MIQLILILMIVKLATCACNGPCPKRITCQLVSGVSVPATAKGILCWDDLNDGCKNDAEGCLIQQECNSFNTTVYHFYSSSAGNAKNSTILDASNNTNFASVVLPDKKRTQMCLFEQVGNNLYINAVAQNMNVQNVLVQNMIL